MKRRYMAVLGPSSTASHQRGACPWRSVGFLRIFTPEFSTALRLLKRQDRSGQGHDFFDGFTKSEQGGLLHQVPQMGLFSFLAKHQQGH